VPLDSTAMGGVIALVGSGEFTPAMDAVDRELLAATGRDRPRVAIVPTASWPDGRTVFMRWATMGEEHFSALGAEPVAVLIEDRTSADDPAAAEAISTADLVYFSGGKPGHLLEALRDSAAGAALREAYRRGAVIAGCSAGAMVLAAHQLRVGGRGFLQPPFGWQDGLGLVPRLVVVPHYDAFPETLALPLALAAPRGALVVGIDEETALVGGGGLWRVRGRGRVTVWRGTRRERHRAGSRVMF
jgi:cyanophycinase